MDGGAWLEFQPQHQSSRIEWFDLLAVQETCQESSPAPQFQSINSSVLSFLYGPTLMSVYDYWKTHSFDYPYTTLFRSAVLISKSTDPLIS